MGIVNDGVRVVLEPVRGGGLVCLLPLRADAREHWIMARLEDTRGERSAGCGGGERSIFETAALIVRVDDCGSAHGFRMAEELCINCMAGGFPSSEEVAGVAVELRLHVGSDGRETGLVEGAASDARDLVQVASE